MLKILGTVCERTVNSRKQPSRSLKTQKGLLRFREEAKDTVIYSYYVVSPKKSVELSIVSGWG